RRQHPHDTRWLRRGNCAAQALRVQPLEVHCRVVRDVRNVVENELARETRDEQQHGDESNEQTCEEKAGSGGGHASGTGWSVGGWRGGRIAARHRRQGLCIIARSCTLHSPYLSSRRSRTMPAARDGSLVLRTACSKYR